MADPDPFAKAVLADLPAVDELSGRQKRIAAGLALIQSGKTIYAAAKELGIPYNTLWRYANGISSVGTSAADARSGVETDILDMSLAVTLRGTERLLDMLEHDQMRPPEVAKAVQVTRDTAAMLRGWKDNAGTASEQTTNALVAALDRLRLRDKANQAVDVDVVEESE